jgi:hypothetical protein
MCIRRLGGPNTLIEAEKLLDSKVIALVPQLSSPRERGMQQSCLLMPLSDGLDR